MRYHDTQKFWGNKASGIQSSKFCESAVFFVGGCGRRRRRGMRDGKKETICATGAGSDAAAILKVRRLEAMRKGVKMTGI